MVSITCNYDDCFLIYVNYLHKKNCVNLLRYKQLLVHAPVVGGGLCEHCILTESQNFVYYYKMSSHSVYIVSKCFSTLDYVFVILRLNAFLFTWDSIHIYEHVSLHVCICTQTDTQLTSQLPEFNQNHLVLASLGTEPKLQRPIVSVRRMITYSRVIGLHTYNISQLKCKLFKQNQAIAGMLVESFPLP